MDNKMAKKQCRVGSKFCYVVGDRIKNSAGHDTVDNDAPFFVVVAKSNSEALKFAKQEQGKMF